MEVAYLALGSNLGDRLTNLQQAVDALSDVPRTEILRISPVYQTEAHTLEPGQVEPAYLNAVIEIRTGLSPLELLRATRQIEREGGRERRTRWASRTLDVDVIAFGNVSLNLPELTIPHPRLAERKFVLRPFSDLSPDTMLPDPLNATVYSLLQETPDRGEVRPYPTGLVLPHRTTR